MRRKPIMITFLTMIIIFIIGPMAFAEGPKIPIFHISKSPNENLVLEKDPVTWESALDAAWWQQTIPSVGPKVKTQFNVHDLLSCHSDSCPGSSLISIESASTDELKTVDVERDIEPGIIVGLKFTFKRFRLHCLHRSIISFFSNTPKNERHNGQSLAFYFEVP